MEHVYKSSLYLSTSGFARKLIRTEYNFEIQNKATKSCSNKLKNNKAVGAYKGTLENWKLRKGFFFKKSPTQAPWGANIALTYIGL